MNGWYAAQHFVNIGTPSHYSYEALTLWDVIFDQEAIRAQGLLVNTPILPTPHRLAGHEIFDCIAEYHIAKTCAAFECAVAYRLGGVGYDNTL